MGGINACCNKPIKPLETSIASSSRNSGNKKSNIYLQEDTESERDISDKPKIVKDAYTSKSQPSHTKKGTQINLDMFKEDNSEASNSKMSTFYYV